MFGDIANRYLPRFVYIKVGLAALLVFAGVKILIAEVRKMPVAISVAVIVAILAISVGASLWATQKRTGNKLDVPKAEAGEGAGVA